uniref:Phosphatidylinositol 3,4,5-trisphosphate 3-phosphatase TPTE2-like n=1 Tax=Crassostrea virginica TaxID=6565 RepID=A0A8B8EN45_CRAVI|nr:phosphatidylinositol 3,4,5-trisphosphate 3-phosphatase TPTE2-like [Crassostrea virginica]XP_022341346.1 phosphatidylinositol 3,4,5-trisphosphate 3-phosphatase TPTE2-like [Crassostrea virginica]
MDEEVQVTVEAPDSMINPDSMSQNENMQPKQTTDDLAGNQSEAIETDVFILMGKQVENDLNVYEDDGKNDQRDEIDDDDNDDNDEIDDDNDDDQLRDKFILEESEDPAHNFPNTKTGKLRYMMGKVMENLLFRVFTILLILLDISIQVTDLAAGSSAHYHDELEIVSRVIITYFVVETMCRIFYKGDEFFRHWADIVDMIIVFVTFIIDYTLGGYARLSIIGRGVRIIRAIRGIYIMYSGYRQFKKATRKVVSQNKRRYRKEGFDLDLCYVTERVIAMSYPSSGMRSLYRNPIKKVGKFLDKKHSEHYKVYDLCSEMTYNRNVFHNRVEKVRVDDHNVPRLKDMITFCADVKDWLKQDDKNIIAVHCKGGKGRTGTMICTWLIHTELFEQAEESLNYFGERRTDRREGSMFQGVETPSQSRYVEYYEKVKWELGGNVPPIKTVRITSIRVNSIKGVGKGDGTDLSLQVWLADKKIGEWTLKNPDHVKLVHSKEEDYINITLHHCPSLSEDVKCRFLSTSRNIPKVYDNSAFYFWFHTSFIEKQRLHLERDQIDNPHKKKAQKVFRESFSVTLHFKGK